MTSDLEEIKEAKWEIHKDIRKKLQTWFQDGIPTEKKDDVIPRVHTRRRSNLNKKYIVLLDTCLLHFCECTPPFRFGEVIKVSMTTSIEQNLDGIAQFFIIALKMGVFNLIGKQITDIKSVRDITTSQFQLSDYSKEFVQDYKEKLNKLDKQEKKLLDTIQEELENKIRKEKKAAEKKPQYELIKIEPLDLSLQVIRDLTKLLGPKSMKKLKKLKVLMIDKLEEGPLLRLEFSRFIKKQHPKLNSNLDMITSAIFEQLLQTKEYVIFFKSRYKGIVKKGTSIEDISDFLKNVSTASKSSGDIRFGIKEHFLKELYAGKEVSLSEFQVWVLKTYGDSKFRDGTLLYYITDIIKDVRNADDTIRRIKRGSLVSYKLK